VSKLELPPIKVLFIFEGKTL